MSGARRGARPCALDGGRAAAGAEPAPATRARSTARGRSLITLMAVIVLAAFLSPLLQSALTSLKTPGPDRRQPVADLPGRPGDLRATRARSYDVYEVPIDGTVRELALVEGPAGAEPVRRPGRTRTPAPIAWEGSWRTLEPAVGVRAARGELRARSGTCIDFPRLLFNTVADRGHRHDRDRAVSCTLVAYGFARFRFPGRNLLFTLLIATIFLPAAVTLIPTYTIFVKLGWVGTWLPLLVPTFFANAYDVFLMRQYFMTIPRELDEAAAIDGAGPAADPRVGHPAAGLAGHRRGRDLPLRLLVERLLRAADLPVGAAASSSRSRSAWRGSTASTTRTRRYIQAGTMMTLRHPGRRCSSSSSASSPAASSSPASRSRCRAVASP